MKVYIVTSGSYSDYHIDAVCETREKAEKILALISDKDYWHDDAQIEEYDTDTFLTEPIYEWEIEAFIVRKMRLDLIDHIEINSFHGDDDDGAKDVVCRDKAITAAELLEKLREPNCWSGSWKNPYKEFITFYVYTTTRDKDKALKIANDIIAEVNYQQHMNG